MFPNIFTHFGPFLPNEIKCIFPFDKQKDRAPVKTAFGTDFDGAITSDIVSLLKTKIMEKIKEEFKVRGEELVEKIKQLIHEGNVRRLIIKDETGKVYLEIPVTFGVIGAIVAPMLAAVGAIAAMVANLKIEVIRDKEPVKEEKKEPGKDKV